MKQVEQDASDNSSLLPFGEDFDVILNSYLTPAPSTESFYNFPQSSSPTPCVATLPNAQTSHNLDDYSSHHKHVSFVTLPSPLHSEIDEYLNSPALPPHNLHSPTHTFDSYDSSIPASLPVLQLDDLQSLQYPYFT